MAQLAAYQGPLTHLLHPQKVPKPGKKVAIAARCCRGERLLLRRPCTLLLQRMGTLQLYVWPGRNRRQGRYKHGSHKAQIKILESHAACMEVQTQACLAQHAAVRGHSFYLPVRKRLHTASPPTAGTRQGIWHSCQVVPW